MKTILHCDANNFYATVECAIDPTLKGKPLAVSGNPDKRHGIILAKSMEAKAYGISTGEAIWQAKLKCPNLILVAPRHDEYVKYSEKLFAIYTQFTDKVESFGIDECWLDCTETVKLFGDGVTIADTLRERIKAELGITISVGVSFTKIFAKLGSDIKKPDATTLISKDNYKTIAWTLPVGDLLMVGRKTNKMLNQLNIFTIGDLANAHDSLLTHYFGINGVKLKQFAGGIETENVRYYYNNHIPESVGNSTTTPVDITNISEAKAVIVGLSEMIATRLRKHGLIASSISLGIKHNDLSWEGKQCAIGYRTFNSSDIADNALKLLPDLHDFKTDLPIRAIAISTFKLENWGDSLQLSIFDKENDKLNKLDNSVDKLRGKYGYSILKKGITIAHSNLCDDLEVGDFQPFKK